MIVCDHGEGGGCGGPFEFILPNLMGGWGRGAGPTPTYMVEGPEPTLSIDRQKNEGGTDHCRFVESF